MLIVYPSNSLPLILDSPCKRLTLQSAKVIITSGVISKLSTFLDPRVAVDLYNSSHFVRLSVRSSVRLS